MVVTIDLESEKYMRENGICSYFYDCSHLYNVTTNKNGFYFPMKLQVVSMILDLGYDVLLTDTDVIWRLDPIQYLFYKNIDFMTSLDIICPSALNWVWGSRGKIYGMVNSGFMLIRATEATKRQWKYLFEVSLKSDIDDQTLINNVMVWNDSVNNPFVYSHKNKIVPWCAGLKDAEIDNYMLTHNLKRENVIVHCPLDECMFSSGAIGNYDAINLKELKTQLYYRSNMQSYTIHANIISGHREKQKHLMSNNLWIATEGNFSRTGNFRYWDGKCKKCVLQETDLGCRLETMV
jgi:hypothetical protein